MDKKIFFASSNLYKAQTYAKRLLAVGWTLEHIILNMPESRDFECVDVAANKLAVAQQKLDQKYRPLFVEDRGFELECLNGFPESHVKDLTELIGINTILPLVNKKNNKAKFVYAIALVEENGNLKHFQGEEEGYVINPQLTTNLDLKDIFCHPEFPDTPLSALSEEDLKRYENLWTKKDALAGLINYLLAK